MSYFFKRNLNIVANVVVSECAVYVTVPSLIKFYVTVFDVLFRATLYAFNASLYMRYFCTIICNYYITKLQCTLHLYIHANEQTLCVDYEFNSSYINWKQNKTHIHCAKNKPNFTAVNNWNRHRTSEFFT